MKKTTVFAVIAMLVFLSACSGTKVDTKPYKAPAITGNVVEETKTAPEPQEPEEPESQEPGQTAAEVLKELTQNDIDVQSAGVKSASSLYAGVTGEGQGIDALKSKTKALFRQSSGVEDVDADREFGSRFDDLPDEYDNDDSAGE